MFSWRVTKYNPELRNEDGSYINQDEWTSISDVGTKVSEKEYLKVESIYLDAIEAFLREIGVDKVSIEALELHILEEQEPSVHSFLSKLEIGIELTTSEIRELSKWVLREVIWCKLSVQNQCFIHFGYDYYLYIGANRNCPNAIKEVEQLGLYVEVFQTPYSD
ncbi:hypothetical protein ACIQ2D_18805 [Lysinibacillus sp. NPDC097287]|uniref:hypothetical protein n=1 Tax=Lysinibacillus sp. NPDC097287 TaxID=3364144 RepID=UPI00382FB6B6